MVNVELVIFIVILLLSFWFIFKYRDRVKIEVMLGIPLKKPIRIFGIPIKKFPLIYAVLIRTKIGLKFTDKIVEKLKNKSKWIGYGCIVVGIISALYMSYLLINHIIVQLTTPTSTVQAVAFVLPFKVKGAIYVPLVYWLLSILILATIHEFGHALLARAYDIKVKYTGPAFFGILIPLIPAAYVEPDEKEIKKRPRKQQLSVYSAGAVFNIVSGLLALVILMGLSMATNHVVDSDGVVIDRILSENLKKAGLKEGQIIDRLDFGKFEYPISGPVDVANAIERREPGTEVTIRTRSDSGYYQNHLYKIEPNPKDSSKGMLGVSVSQHESFKEEAIQKYGLITIKSVKWLRGLFLWISLLSIGIGFFNLLPMIPLDGGLMVKSFVQNTKFEKPVTFGVSGIFLLILILLFFI